MFLEWIKSTKGKIILLISSVLFITIIMIFMTFYQVKKPGVSKEESKQEYVKKQVLYAGTYYADNDNQDTFTLSNDSTFVSSAFGSGTFQFSKDNKTLELLSKEKGHIVFALDTKYHETIFINMSNGETYYVNEKFRDIAIEEKEKTNAKKTVLYDSIAKDILFNSTWTYKDDKQEATLTFTEDSYTVQYKGFGLDKAEVNYFKALNYKEPDVKEENTYRLDFLGYYHKGFKGQKFNGTFFIREKDGQYILTSKEFNFGMTTFYSPVLSVKAKETYSTDEKGQLTKTREEIISTSIISNE
ncbi:hypothetical protein GMA11_06180 [Granulicatella sp. zg-ZJ]|uniref:hypothetical protein n=1 Tax=Granulicatella sp. zg-ZJ TaxID=2678504 RepID=UPI0013D23AEA|nr:hypothetical protein [Granulicatella sp. zg-ZJ]MBS4749591.1 hypothetical protein [Carnobacteriaceae bacterium zg-ZUI78]NEW62433.1 hypothetical protein [Granulicatella sp. zg-ZJ]NEW62979.1 hypothetical protein [Granulicatella sp. zg-ZJ]